MTEKPIIRRKTVTVNGKRYDSIDDVPATDRDRIQAMRKASGVDDDLMSLLEALKAEAAATEAAAKTGAGMGSGIDPAAGATVPAAAPKPGFFSKLLRFAVGVLGAAMAWATMRYFVLV